MKAYVGREAPPPSQDDREQMQHKLLKAIEQVKIANTFLSRRHSKNKMLWLDPAYYGLNFATYNPEGAVVGYAEVGELTDVSFRELRDKGLPVTYAAQPFLIMPAYIHITRPVALVVSFKDCLAWALISDPEKDFQWGHPRVGDIKVGGQDATMLVLDFASSDFKILEE